jgi:hypothetical protein
MKKKKNVHYRAEAAGAEAFYAACSAPASREQITSDKRRVTCENCIRTKLYKLG